MRIALGDLTAARRCAQTVVLAVLLMVSSPALAADLSIDAFVGTFKGSGIASSANSIYAPETARDMDVQIRRVGNGFAVTWTTVLREEDGTVKRKTETLSFEPDGADGLYRTSERPNAFTEGGLAWARIKEQTLDIHILGIDAEGRYNLQHYARTLSGRGMELEYTRNRDGAQSRVVRGLLVKVAQ